jgi:peptidoglycan/LPS O-acetylase OafA/YrhL
LVPERATPISELDQPHDVPPAERTSRIPELDGLRGIAIVLVVVFHSFYFSPGPEHHTTGLIRTAYVFMEHFLRSVGQA